MTVEIIVPSGFVHPVCPCGLSHKWPWSLVAGHMLDSPAFTSHDPTSPCRVMVLQLPRLFYQTPAYLTNVVYHRSISLRNVTRRNAGDAVCFDSTLRLSLSNSLATGFAKFRRMNCMSNLSTPHTWVTRTIYGRTILQLDISIRLIIFKR